MFGPSAPRARRLALDPGAVLACRGKRYNPNRSIQIARRASIEKSSSSKRRTHHESYGRVFWPCHNFDRITLIAGQSPSNSSYKSNNGVYVKSGASLMQYHFRREFQKLENEQARIGMGRHDAEARFLAKFWPGRLTDSERALFAKA